MTSKTIYPRIGPSVGAALLVLCLFGIAVCADAQSTFGSIVGVMKDPGGLVVPSAEITLSSLDEQSDANGGLRCGWRVSVHERESGAV